MTKHLCGKHIVVGVSAGIAAYKSIEIVSRLRKAGAEVKVVMTKNATRIAPPLPFGEISGHMVAVDMWAPHEYNVEHIALATWADAFIVAPATANVIGKFANGIADDMLSTTIMATEAPKFLCPAMNSVMYNNPIVQRNLNTLHEVGYSIMTPNSGWLACGIEGIGRLPEPEEIVSWLDSQLTGAVIKGIKPLLQGQTVLVTAGGTQENIDPVRYIGNRSSGKMGYAIAEAAKQAGARVILVSAPTHLTPPAGVEFVPVESASSMEEAVNQYFDDAQVVIMAAAVSDFRVVQQQEQKIKKMESMTLELIKNPDILYGLGLKKKRQVLVGFAAETERLVEYGMGKVEKKNLDMLVANDVSKADRGFNVDTNEGYFLFPHKEAKIIPNISKQDMATAIMAEVSQLLQDSPPS